MGTLSSKPEKGWSPNHADKHLSLSDSPGRPSCDATSLKLGIINFISQHDESPNEQPAADCYFSFGVTPAQPHPFVNSSQVWIFTDRYLTRLYQKKSQQPRPLFADRTDPLPLSGTVFHRIETGIGRDLPRIGKALHLLQGVHQTKTGQRTDSIMRPQPSHPLVGLSFLPQPLLHLVDLRLQLHQQLAKLVSLLP